MKKIILLYLFSILFFTLSSQSIGTIGSPFVQSYDATVYPGNNQNWSATQDNRGVMYFANTSGIVTYNGTKWDIVPIASNSTVRTVKIAPDSTIYYAGKGDIGYLKTTKDGKTIIHSLVNLYEKKEDVELSFRKVCITSKGAYFFLAEQILFYNQDSISTIDFPVASMFGNTVKDNLFAINKNGGIYCFDGIKNNLLPNTEELTLEGGRIIILEYDKDNLLIIVQNKGIFKYNIGQYFDKNTGKYNFSKTSNNSALSFFQTGLEEYIKLNMPYSGAKIDENTFCVGTIYGGLVVIDKKGNLQQIYNKNRGLLDNSITGVYVDKNKNIWVSHLKGISYIHHNPKVTTFSENEGIESSAYFVHKFNDTVYVGTSLGLFYLPPHELNITDDKSIFKFTEGTKDRVWGLISIKDLIVATTSNFILVVNGDKVVNKYEQSDGYCLEVSEKFPEYILIGREHGFSAVKYKYENSNISFVEQIDFENVLSSLRNILQTENSVWLTSSYDGIYRVKFGDDIHDYEVIHYDTISGLPDMSNNYLMTYENKLFAGTGTGTYLYDSNTDKFIKSDILKSETVDSSGIYGLHKFKDKLFILTANSIFGCLIDKDNDGNFELDRGFGIKLRSYQTYETFIDKDNILWLSTNQGVGRIDLNYNHEKYPDFNTLITKFIAGKDSVLFYGTFYTVKGRDTLTTSFSNKQPQSEIPVLDYEFNSIRIHYSSTFYEQNENNLYSYILKGHDAEWSDWTEETYKDYNLREGKYTFMVKSKNIYEEESLVSTYEFIVKPPWYRTIVAYIIYFILFVALVYIIVYLNSIRLKKQNQRLEKIIDKRTAEIREKNEELFQQKEEIQSQAELLETKNKELEKLSIVASETDNAVLIMDKEGNLEWANDGFERLYGYNLEQFIKRHGKNLYEVATNKDIKEAVDKCFSTKKSVIYESESKTKSGDNIWLQTTLTPILDENNDVRKLIAVETDIRKLKEYEIDILQKSEEINAQNEELEQKNDLLKEHNESIQASIRYALTIQQAILPEKKLMQKFFDVFILYKPKDIVSGDFYWFSHFCKTDTTPETSFISVIDCTGHGVPGAFMSMISNTLLNQIVNEKKIFKPSKILTLISKAVVSGLKQDTTENQDGMDMCFAKIEKINDNKYDVTFSGAKRPLFYYEQKDKELKKLQADRISIGGTFYKHEKEFTDQTISLSNGDLIYLTTDGFIDQNNSKRKRFGTANFTETVSLIAEKPVEQQKQILEEILAKWMGNEPQRDDIALVGLKF